MDILGAVEAIDLESIMGGSICSKLSMTLMLIGMEGRRNGLTSLPSEMPYPLLAEQSLVSLFLPLLSLLSLISQISIPCHFSNSSCLYF